MGEGGFYEVDKHDRCSIKGPTQKRPHNLVERSWPPKRHWLACWQGQLQAAVWDHFRHDADQSKVESRFPGFSRWSIMISKQWDFRTPEISGFRQKHYEPRPHPETAQVQTPQLQTRNRSDIEDHLPALIGVSADRRTDFQQKSEARIWP